MSDYVLFAHIFTLVLPATLLNSWAPQLLFFFIMWATQPTYLAPSSLGEYLRVWFIFQSVAVIPFAISRNFKNDK